MADKPMSDEELDDLRERNRTWQELSMDDIDRLFIEIDRLRAIETALRDDAIADRQAGWDATDDPESDERKSLREGIIEDYRDAVLTAAREAMKSAP